MLLELVSAAVGSTETVNAAPVEITDLAYDSRSVTQGSLFFCVRGGRIDGHDLAADAIAAGATALVVERPLPLPVPQVVVASARAAMPRAAVAFFNDPTALLKVVAVTGTNGKTTSAYLLDAILRAAGYSAGLLTNIERRAGGESLPTGLNTPEAIDLQRIFRTMVDAGDTACVMEATSIASSQGRLDGTRFAVLLFTNLTQDHLDFHGSMDEYFDAKRRLFEQSDIAVINTADEWGKRLADTLPDAITFDGDSPILDGTRLALRGTFNRTNAAGAALAARALGISDDEIRQGLESVRGVPGRFEPIDEGQPFTVLVDYAHTPDGLENILRAARELVVDGRLIVVFGAGGDRDRTKRPQMGEVVARLADTAIVTSDNPRSEDPAVIAAEVAAGMGSAHAVELDRRKAIHRALEHAHTGDVVVLAGRGAEAEQDLASGKGPFDDREVARSALRALWSAS